jgi:hypothetical protein
MLVVGPLAAGAGAIVHEVKPENDEAKSEFLAC